MRDTSADRRLRAGRAAAALLLLLVTGCSLIEQLHPRQPNAFNDPYLRAATSIEYPDVNSPPDSRALWTPEPFTLTGNVEPDYRDITLEEAIRQGLAQSKVMRDLGGLVLRTPQATDTTFDVALVESDPRFGIEAALAEFDAQLASSVVYEHNDRALNNIFTGGGTNLFRQRTSSAQTEIAKRTAFGGEFFLRNNLNFDANNASGNQIGSRVWDLNVETGFRQSLLRGAGVDVNRIAGGSGIPGVYNGVLIARTRSDIGIADFELGVRDFVSNVENAYWDLYFAYRDLDTKIFARDSALDTWRQIDRLQGDTEGEAGKEAQAREQYYRFEEEVQNALTGRLTEPTRTFSGSPGGTFRRMGGVHVAERRLRYLLDLPINEGVLLRPTDEPIDVPIAFDWDLSVAESLMNRTELRRQKWEIKQRELELIAARNFLKPQLDVVGLYRWRGIGRSLLDPGDGGPRFDDATANFLSGDFQEWQLGVEFTVPIGNRQAHAGVRNAEFRLVREQSLLREQEHLVMRDLSDAYADVDRAYGLVQTITSRWDAARDQLSALEASYKADRAPLYLVLDAQRRLAFAESRYYEALVEYTLAVKNMHFQKGSLLEYAGIHLAEGSWSRQAHEDARERLERRKPIDSIFVPGHRVITGNENAGRVFVAPQ